MGSDAVAIPPLPPGFELDDSPALPPGFEPDPQQPAAKPPTRQVGVAESAGRVLGASAIPVVQTAGLATGGVLEALKKAAAVADVVGHMFNTPMGLTQRVQEAQDAVFRAHDETVQSMSGYYKPQPGEEFSTPGAVVGGLASLPVEALGGLGMARGIARTADVLQRGGSLGDASVAGAVTGVANMAANALPVKAGGAVARGLEGAVARVLPQATPAATRVGGAVAGGVTGGAIGGASSVGVTAAENVALPEGAQFADLQAEADPAVATGLAAALGAVSGGRAPVLRAPVGSLPGADGSGTRPAPATPGTQGSAGAAGTDKAEQRRALARGLPVPFEGDSALTKGQATRSFEDQRFERETAKDPDMGAKLRERAAAQNETALRNLDALEAFTGAQKADRGASGQAVVDAIAAKAQRAKDEIDAAYAEAREAGDMAEMIDVSPLARWITENQSSAGNAGVISTAEGELVRLGGADRAADGSLAAGELSINDLEELRKKVVAGGKKDATNAHFAAEINRVIDRATEGRGGELYGVARGKFKAYQAEFKDRGAIRDLIGIKKGTSDRITATEKVLERAMRSADDLRNVRETLITAGEDGVQAWREVQGQAMRKLRDEVTGNAAKDIRGNDIVSPAKLKRLINSWDSDGRLEVLFGKKGAETLRDFRDVGQDLFTAPPGAVNTSNTASVIAKWMADSAASFVATGVPAPLIGLTKTAWKMHKDRKVRQQVDQALGPKETTSAAGEVQNPFAGSDKLPEVETKPPPAAAPDISSDPRLQEINRLRAEVGDSSPETLRVLDREARRIEAELRNKQAAAGRESEADALESAARSTFEPAVRQALLARANALRSERIPVGEAREVKDAPPAKAAQVPVGQASELSMAEASRLAPTRRESELMRLREEVTDPEVLKDLDRDIAAERKRAADAAKAEEYRRLAERATEPDVRADLEARARKLAPTKEADKIPAGEARELDVETVEPATAPEVADLPDADHAIWAAKWGFGDLDAQATRDVRTARGYDADAVERAAEQHGRSPVAFARAIERIIDEGKARESQAERAAGSSEGLRGPSGGVQGAPGQPAGGADANRRPGGGEPGVRPRAADGSGGGDGSQGPEGPVDGAPGGEPGTRFSRGGGTTGIETPEAERVVAAIRSEMPGAPPIRIHESLDTAPPALRDKIRQDRAEGDVEAALHDGEIHVFTKNIQSAERLAFVVGHHEARHAGLRSLLGQQMDGVARAIWDTNPALREAAQRKMADGHAATREIAVDEALADMPVAALAKLNGWNKVVAGVRQWLRQVAGKLRARGMPSLAAAFEPARWTDNDVAALVSRAEDVSRGRRGTFDPDDPDIRFSRAATGESTGGGR